MKARKENKVYRIDEDSKKRYLEEGFDIYSDEGNLIEHSPKKKISYGEHERQVNSLNEEINALNEEIAGLKTELEVKKPKAPAKKEGE